MSLLGDVITVAQLFDAELPELGDLFNAVKDAIDQKNAAAATQASIAAVDVAVDVNEDLKFPKADG
ncbi:MAG TPA: hypothetical protein VK841_05310 [Polyangiaceae bacterium]|jgi:hypothetical protein|nr:hypothetical protein [Polyangiaceae bacterium]